MCGIIGIVGPQAQALAAWVPCAMQALSHRGPDSHGVWQGDGAVLGHRRLAVIDLSAAGAQPMVSQSGQSVIVYNGEVYGTARLRDQLAGVQWRGHSDTEVLLEQLERHGLPDPWAHNGMYALALWRVQTRELVLARDPIGIKPLYYAQVPGAVAFASEMQAFDSLAGVDRRLDKVALSHYLTLGFVPAPWTMWHGIRQLRPGERLHVDAQGVARSELCSERIGSHAALAPGDLDAQLQQIVLQAVADQLESDVPVGVLLSGGVDSSVVAAAAARHTTQLRTFAVVHANPAYDERKAARAVAQHLGSDHTEIELPTAGLTREELDDLVRHHGDPFADSSSLPTRRLAREVKKHVTVALSGDGGDELFAGYPRYRQNTWANAAAHLPELALRLGGVTVQQATAWAPNERARGALRRVARLGQLAQRNPNHRAIGTLTWFWPDEQAELLSADWMAPAQALDDWIAEHARDLGRSSHPDACHRFEQRTILPDDMLVKVDRMTMAESLEIRPPLLDGRLVRFAASLPIDRKLHGREGKAILKKLARRWVPPWVIDRPKQGFAVPLLDFGGSVLDDASRWAVQGADSPLRVLFKPDALAQLQREFARRGEGVAPEDSPFRRAHRQWALTLLALALQRSNWSGA